MAPMMQTSTDSSMIQFPVDRFSPEMASSPAHRQMMTQTDAPSANLPLWGRRVEFDAFYVELVPPGDRVMNACLPEMSASINFGPAEGTLSLAGDRIRPYDRRSFEYFLVPPDFPIQGETRQAPEVLAFVIKFDRICGIVGEALGVDACGINPDVVIGAPKPFIAEIAKKIRRQLMTTQYSRPYLEALCTAILVEMFRPIVERQSCKSREPAGSLDLDLVLDYIEENLDGDLGIGRLANLAGVSPHSLSRAFKDHVGEPPHSYVIQRRTDSARRLLETGDRPLAEIAFTCGFSSQSHMSTAFKKVFGVSPGAFRRRAHT